MLFFSKIEMSAVNQHTYFFLNDWCFLFSSKIFMISLKTVFKLCV